jgi:hypothetical protein
LAGATSTKEVAFVLFESELRQAKLTPINLNIHLEEGKDKEITRFVGEIKVLKSKKDDINQKLRHFYPKSNTVLKLHVI